ncbi:OmpA family protein [Herbaspirillum sp. alder98]|uniref:OmpA family protein n=1 Tax=Herbaspirillum sp. alder98 TaxID=2913096 RepID=UPI001CD91674|nr:OmpA family protein [Herbaspirillum sp. alder98]MCA1324873.1 OmpA family protein [Herbaspirillum sp. alder98]
MQKNKKLGVSVAVLCCLVSSGCAVDPKTGQPSFKETFASDDPCSNNARNVGIAVGVVAGLIIGNQVKHSNTARLAGAAAGAAIGGLIGASMDSRRCELYKIAKQNNLEMQVDDILASAPVGATASSPDAAKPEVVGMKVAIKDNGTQFRSGSDVLSPEAQAYFGAIADQYSFVQQSKRLNAQSSKDDVAAVELLKTKQIFLVGHTDDTGDSALNADLSARRANAVGRVFRDRGVPESQIFYQGAGETLPVADNRTDEGRARNRRVEIVDTPNQATFTQYLESRKPNLAFYRPTSETVTAAAEAPTRIAKPAPSVPARAATTRKNSATTKGAVSPAPAVAANTDKAATSASTPTPSARLKTAAAAVGVASVDFGGAPANGNFVVPNIGGPQQASSSFNLISSAHADAAVPLTSCAQDRPRVATGVKALSNGREQNFSTADYLPGVYDSSWSGSVNGHLVALTHVAVLKDGGAPARAPTLLVYQNYAGGKNVEPVYRGTPEVNTYRGANALLYRVFANGPAQCMDIVIPNNNPKTAPNSNLVYQRGGVLYQVAFAPSLVR